MEPETKRPNGKNGSKSLVSAPTLEGEEEEQPMILHEALQSLRSFVDGVHERVSRKALNHAAAPDAHDGTTPGLDLLDPVDSSDLGDSAQRDPKDRDR